MPYRVSRCEVDSSPDCIRWLLQIPREIYGAHLRILLRRQRTRGQDCRSLRTRMHAPCAAAECGRGMPLAFRSPEAVPGRRTD